MYQPEAHTRAIAASISRLSSRYAAPTSRKGTESASMRISALTGGAALILAHRGQQEMLNSRGSNPLHHSGWRQAPCRLILMKSCPAHAKPLGKRKAQGMID